MMKIMMEIDQMTNLISSLEVASGVYPEIMNSGYKRDISSFVDEKNLILFKKLNSIDFLKSVLSKNFDRNLVFQKLNMNFHLEKRCV